MPPERKTVAEMMSREVVSLDPNEEISTAEKVMGLGRIRHLPVVDEEGRLVGILSQRDLFRSALLRSLGYGQVLQDRALKGLRVKEVMATEVETTAPDVDIAEAAARMAKHKIGCLPVLEGDRLVGILTEGDFVAAFARTRSGA